MFDFIKQNPFLWLFIFLLIVAPSFLVGAFQVIAVVVLIIVAFMVVGMLVLRWKVKKFQQQMGGNQQRGYGAYTDHSTSQQRGSKDGVDVKIYTSANEKRVSNDVGDYVDFEEVKDPQDEK